MTALLDHIGLPVSSLERSRTLYEAALATLGYKVVKQSSASVGFGRDRKPELTLFQSTQAPAPAHIAFAASSREMVDAFYQAALAAGATDNGAPGLRPEYHVGYYGAFLLDADGNNVEAVFHEGVI